jgi:hypothetical protein
MLKELFIATLGAVGVIVIGCFIFGAVYVCYLMEAKEFLL